MNPLQVSSDTSGVTVAAPTDGRVLLATMNAQGTVVTIEALPWTPVSDEECQRRHRKRKKGPRR